MKTTLNQHTIHDNPTSYNYKENKLISDELRDGGTFEVTFTNYFFEIKDTSLHKLTFQANLLETDDNYYKYHRSLEKYHDGDDPFTEFSPIYSNIKGGYGIFSGYVKYEKTLILK